MSTGGALIAITVCTACAALLTHVLRSGEAVAVVLGMALAVAIGGAKALLIALPLGVLGLWLWRRYGQRL